jgi:Fur family transcriptional regulator, iron response regulator
MSKFEMDLIRRLKEHGLSASAQRLAVARFVLTTTAHPSADQVLAAVQKKFPSISRATVYNTLNAFVKCGLLRELVLAEGKTVFDPNMGPHHHFIDDVTHEIEDIPWQALSVDTVERLPTYQIREYMVVLRGVKTARASGRKKSKIAQT